MRDTKGFSLVEAMIGMVILAFIIAGTMSFFILWSSRSAESFRYKDADETVSTAISLITSDLRKAGFGVTTNPECAVFSVDRGDTTADELYVNCGDYLNFEGDIRAPTSDPNSVAYRCINSVFKPNRTFIVSGVNLAYQAKFALSNTSSFVLYGIPAATSATRYGNIGALIASSGTGTAAGAADVDVSLTSYVNHLDGTGTPTGIQDWTFPLINPGRNSTGGSMTLTAGTIVAPAISYKVVAGTGGNGGALWRNRGKDAAPFGSPILGGSPFLDLKNLQVRYEFTNGASTWWDDVNSSPASLRVVQVTLTYRVMLGKNFNADSSHKIYGWSKDIQRQMIVAPRSVALGAQM